MTTYFTQPMNFQNAFNTVPLSKEIRSHLSQVHISLVFTTLASAAGVYVHMTTGFNSPFITMMAMLGIMMYIHSDTNKEDHTRRMGWLLAFGVAKGLSIGPLVSLAIDVDPSLVVIAVLATATVFTCFSLVALLSERRSFFFIGGIMSSYLSLSFWLFVVNMFIYVPFAFIFQLYGGLFVFSLYVIYDTQMIIEKRNRGSKDIIGHALELFVDLMAIFVRILIILMRNNEKSKKKKSRR